MGVLISQRTSSELKKEIGGNLAGLAFQLSDKLDHYMWSRYNEILLLSGLEAFRDPGRVGEAQKLLNELSEDIPSFSWVGLTDGAGSVKASTGEILVGTSIAERPVFMEALEKPFIGDVHDAVLLAKLLPNPTGEPLKFVDISAPLYDDAGNFTGVLAAHLSWQWSKEIRDTVFQSLQGNDAHAIEAFVISAKDNTVLLGPEEWIGKQLQLEGGEERSAAGDWTVQEWPDGSSYLTGFALGSGYQNYPGLGWKVVVRQPAGVAFASVDSLVVDIALLGVLLTVVFAALGWILAGRVSGPLSRISAAADRLRFGEKTEIPLAKGIKDIEVLSSSLRGLVVALTETESELERMEDQAHRDKLTGLLNRVSLESSVAKAIQQAEENDGGLAFLYLDLDGFKGVNDTLGHAAGDELLRQVAQRLTDGVRGHDLVFRMGGDEFVVILSLPARGALLEAKEIASRLLASLRKAYELEGGGASIGCSIGGAMWPDHGRDPELLLRLADEALYESKSKGKNRMTFTDPVKPVRS
ncbi:sensor domain-containing diguanylate cyclase [Paenibacillus soyae]|uniref:Sensor domain-containing diguanylate cyclase n=1 Tax=Paenibacillus soyae TaxID=2969249 RepID=A0A9X2MV66_9BACL|nr:sensor domain-containing diguanylate cyclase [Paenibacillus soyae]MCR2804147.1 sensor domain-containing diguanylate cyclase [Paenibacillus soyae]